MSNKNKKSLEVIPQFTTEPHGAQTLSLMEPDEAVALTIGNRLFRLEGDGGQNVVMTGEELDSLCKQWRQYKINESGSTGMEVA